MSNREFDSQMRPDLRYWRGQFVCVAGKIASSVLERSTDPRKIDHVWIDVDAGKSGLVRIALNTCSLKNRDAGFDSRVRLGIVTSNWDQLPAARLSRSAPLDYAVPEAANPTVYLEREQQELEALLIEKAQRAVAMEAWGEFYMQGFPGIHQVHSRRGSYAMPKDLIGQDGAAQFYFAEKKSCELLLFKFAGQA